MKKIYVDFDSGNDEWEGVIPDYIPPIGPVRTLDRMDGIASFSNSPRSVLLKGYTSYTGGSGFVVNKIIEMRSYMPKEMVLLNALRGDFFTPLMSPHLWEIGFQPADFGGYPCFRNYISLYMHGFGLFAGGTGSVIPNFRTLVYLNGPMFYLIDGVLIVDLILLDGNTNECSVICSPGWNLNLKRVVIAGIPFSGMPSTPGIFNMLDVDSSSIYAEECMFLTLILNANTRLVKYGGNSVLGGMVFNHCVFFFGYDPNVFPDPNDIVLVERKPGSTAEVRFYENLYVGINLQTGEWHILTQNVPNGAIVPDPNPATDLYSWLAKVGGGATAQQVVDAIKADPFARKLSTRLTDDGSVIKEEEKIKLK